MNKGQNELQRLMANMSSGKKVVKPSDDPVGAAMIQDFRTSIDHNKTLEKNIIYDKIWLKSTEDALTQFSEFMMTIKEKAMEGGNGAATKEFRQAMAVEVENIIKDMIRLGNKKEGKLHIFAGTKTFTEPLTLNPRQKDPIIEYDHVRVKSTHSIIPLHQPEPLEWLKPGIFTIQIHNETPVEGELPTEIPIIIEGGESILDIQKKINDAAIAEGGWVPNETSALGYSSKVAASIGNDNNFYLDTHPGTYLTFAEEGPEADFSGFITKMKFGYVGEIPPGIGELPLPHFSGGAVNTDEYGAFFSGYGDREYLARVVKPGGFGEALYVVSDDGGTTWSKNQLLNKQQEIYDPTGLASNKVDLIFTGSDTSFFPEGMEFQFTGNEFVEYHGNSQNKEVLIDNGIKVALNITADEVFKGPQDDPTSTDIFGVLNRLTESLYDDDPEAVMESLNEVDRGIDQVLHLKGRIGTAMVELGSAEERIIQSMDEKASKISEIEDIDIAKASIDLNSAEVKHKVALDSAARLVQPTLINFLK